ncbi:PREDICTED: uncharacterized protein LOC105571211 [Vollenhovia emeryi]|uniref:uncharacterized protein LOC105571211 n=1 Tax=Vollenhovia emeryi TaxID=411798 RepID=UPI0005F4297E|nr:PREDICTED: uncharacterized protein LOC105571211 [Vollenhovia emeryi]
MSCSKCFRANPKPARYIMGDLPTNRVTPNRAFYGCGLDYAGPFYVKSRVRGPANIKTYMCVFVCIVTKAVHLELATDMSTDAFLNCLRRFIARRGKCKHIYCDNGTNFVGAKTELSELYDKLSKIEFQENVTNFLGEDRILWHFNPPSAPNFGGLWESVVKSAKRHLNRILFNTSLTYEELYTVLTQVESCLNSRPLSPLSEDPYDLIPLTPAHFLIGDTMAALPQEDLTNVNTNRLDRYQHLQQLVQHFWNRWRTEYLHQLQTRNKWNDASGECFKPGTLVIIREDHSPPCRWPMARITDIHPGKDGVTRVVTLKCSGYRFLKRPVTKLCILPWQEEKSTPEKEVHEE